MHFHCALVKYLCVVFLFYSYLSSITGHQFRAHKAVLAACSQFFHKFFQDFTQEPLVEIEGIKRRRPHTTTNHTAHIL